MDPYDEATRLYGPPQGTFDAEWVTRIVRQRRPALAWDDASRLVAAAWRHLWASPQLSAEELVAYVALDEPARQDEELATAVAAVLDFVEVYDVEPPRA
jgi:hypothetical protein